MREISRTPLSKPLQIAGFILGMSHAVGSPSDENF